MRPGKRCLYDRWSAPPPQLPPLCRDFSHPALAINADVAGISAGENSPSLGIYNFVVKSNLPAFDRLNPAAYRHLLVVASRLFISNRQSGHGQRQTFMLELGVRAALGAHKVAARFLQPDNVAGVMDNTYLIGFGVTHPKSGFGYRQKSQVSFWIHFSSGPTSALWPGEPGPQFAQPSLGRSRPDIPRSGRHHIAGPPQGQ